MLTVSFGGDIPAYKRAVTSISMFLDPDGGPSNLLVTMAGARLPDPLIFRPADDIMARAAAVASVASRAGQVPVVETCDISFEGMRFFYDEAYGQFVLEGRDGETLVATPVLEDALRLGSEAVRALGHGEGFEPVIGPAPGR